MTICCRPAFDGLEMDHRRVGKAVIAVTALYLVLLVLWVLFIVGRTPSGTLPYQLAGLVALYGAALGLAMMFSARGADIEGWATVTGVRTLGSGESELELEVVIPGSPPYTGLVRARGDWEVGRTITVHADPNHQDRLWI